MIQVEIEHVKLLWGCARNNLTTLALVAACLFPLPSSFLPYIAAEPYIYDNITINFFMKLNSWLSYELPSASDAWLLYYTLLALGIDIEGEGSSGAGRNGNKPKEAATLQTQDQTLSPQLWKDKTKICRLISALEENAVHGVSVQLLYVKNE